MMFQVDELLYTLSAVEYNGGGRRVFFSHGTKTAYFFEAELFGDGRALTDEKKSFCLFVIFGFHQYVSSEILQPHHVVDDRTVITAPTFIHYTVAVITVRYDMCSNIATQ